MSRYSLFLVRIWYKCYSRIQYFFARILLFMLMNFSHFYSSLDTAVNTDFKAVLVFVFLFHSWLFLNSVILQMVLPSVVGRYYNEKVLHPVFSNLCEVPWCLNCIVPGLSRILWKYRTWNCFYKVHLYITTLRFLCAPLVTHPLSWFSFATASPVLFTVPPLTNPYCNSSASGNISPVVLL